jgi:hypothetical protein
MLLTAAERREQKRSAEEVERKQAVQQLGQWSTEDLARFVPWQPMSLAGIPVGVVVYNPHPVEASACCALCGVVGGRNAADSMFKPCPCNRVWHRACFKEWRAGWPINPRNYYSCPDCMYNYRIERVAPDNFQSADQVKSAVRRKIALLWLGISAFVAAAVSVIAAIAWAADQSDKNIPVAVKALLTSVAYGFPNSNSTQEWRDEFKLPSVHVAQFYGLFGAFVVACAILLLSLCTRTEAHQRSQEESAACCGCGCCGAVAFCESQCEPGGACEDCNDSKCSGCDLFSCCGKPRPLAGHASNSTDADPASRQSSNCSNCSNCNCNCNCNDCANCSRADCCSGCGCSGCGDCKCDAKALDPVLGGIILAVIVLVLVSAIFVIVGFAIRRTAQLHDSIATMIRSQQLELENQTVVLGMDEFVRPMTAV